jgi:hypothetical protein
MLDGFNEGWIEFSDCSRSAVKGTTTLDSVIAELVEASRAKAAAWRRRPCDDLPPAGGAKGWARLLADAKCEKGTSWRKKITTQGVAIPRLGFGTFRMPGADAQPVVESAITLAPDQLHEQLRGTGFTEVKVQTIVQDIEFSLCPRLCEVPAARNT